MTSTVSTSGKTVYNPTVTRNFFTNDHELSDSTEDNFITNNDLLKNNVVITFWGVFVCFFSVFVTAYIYLKCFRKRSFESRIKENEWQEYQSLNREAVESQSTTYPEQRRFNVNSVYLSPVFSRNESSETPHGLRENDMRLQINEGLQEISIDGQGYDSSITEIEPHILTDRADHIYVEITEDNTYNLN